jgi:ricin-type beta-trefoil lectin protein
MTALVMRWMRQRATDDSGVAMLMALFVIAMLSAISIGVAGITISQAVPLKVDNKAAQVVQASQAGIDAALSGIRAANDGSGKGVNTLLPCKITGSVNSTSTLAYADTIYYFNSANNPTAHLSDDTWLNANDLAPTPPAAGCLTTSPYIGIPASAGDPTKVPWYAAIVSAATGPRAGSNAQYGDRELRTVYDFVISNLNVAGGPILVFPTASNLCLDGATYPGGTVVKAGNQLYVRTCSATAPGQLFSYTANLTLQITASTGVSPLCVDDAGAANVAAGATSITLQSCDTGPPNQTGAGNDYGQQWSFDGQEEFVGSLADTSNTSGVCLVSNDATPVNGSQVVVKTCPGTAYTNASSWYPNSKVGAGAAGAPLNQLVNYQYFGNCLDIPDFSVSKLFLIGYVCKQNPKPSNVVTTDWNQVWVYNSTTKAYVSTSGSGSWCLQAASSTPTLGDVVYAASCTGGANQQWVYTGGSAGDGHYSIDYEIQSVASPTLCMTLTMPATTSFVTAHASNEDPNGSGGYNLQQWGYADLETCSGADNQKWNAPAGVSNAALSGTYEHPNT